MRYFPIWLDVQNKPCLMVGGGEVAARKAELLIKSGAQLTVVAPNLGANLQRLLESGVVSHIPDVFQPKHLDGMCLVVAATDIEQVNQHVASAARTAKVLLNVVDEPELCDYVNGAVVERDDLTIAISSGGVAPVLARNLKAKLETWLPSAYGELANLVSRYREQVKSRIPFAKRRAFWERVLNGAISEEALAGNQSQAETLLQRAIEKGEPDVKGEVYLIGAGPGDADLLTFKALRLLQKADVVVYDRLIPEGILNLCRREAERVYVGKLAEDHSVPQSEISQCLVEFAKAGKIVARIKGGDPFMFGRGGEEIQCLAEQGVSFQVVPGVTSASGCAAYSGIPLTHRDYAQSCVFVTGHSKNDSLTHLDWAQLAKPQQTVVFFMGLKNAAAIAQGLMDAGAPAQRPMAIVEQGTTRQQRVITTTLGDLSDCLVKETIGSPSLLIVGDVVNLREQLQWYQGEVWQVDGGVPRVFAKAHPAPHKEQ